MVSPLERLGSDVLQQDGHARSGLSFLPVWTSQYHSLGAHCGLIHQHRIGPTHYQTRGPTSRGPKALRDTPTVSPHLVAHSPGALPDGRQT